MRGLPAGDYVAAALPALDDSRRWDPELQAAVRASGQPFSLDEGQTLSLSLELLR